MGGGVKKRKNTLVEAIYHVLAKINGGRDEIFQPN